MNEVITIKLPLPFRMGDVNCYLIKTESGYALIDTGSPKNRVKLERELEKAGCAPGKLRIIILTHGDFDHTGNAAYLRKKFDTMIAMHPDDSGMGERGNMFLNRKKGNILLGMIIRTLYGFGKSKRFKPDIYLEDGFDFSKYEFNMQAIHIPGHSKGSTGILTTDGDLICGDLLVNPDKPKLNSLIDNPKAANRSIEKLRSLKVNTVYPGHGEAFKMEEFLKQFQG